MTVSRKSLRTSVGRQSHQTTRRFMQDVDQLRRDVGMTLRGLAAAADIDAGYLSQTLAGQREPSVAVMTALAEALGADVSLRLYPRAGPRIHDQIQARMVEALLSIIRPPWHASVEVPVTHPVRGYVDVVLDRLLGPLLVAAEIQSRMDRLEQQVRWAQDKAGSLPSSIVWQRVGGEAEISRLLVVRSTVAARELARRFELTLAAAYPARTADVFEALTTPDARPWPGAGILWADVHGGGARILDRPPRGVALGR